MGSKVTIKTFNAVRGMRFEMYGGKFEVSFIVNGTIRYSSTAGGQSHQISFDRFVELQKAGTVVISDITTCSGLMYPDTDLGENARHG
ncbi:hypothetical protein, partial [Janthinobacterium sp. HH104]|uniref:hypothetical protein n=1 Tax=Janthinobacterium sp. HH104 TaxID=1537276 RepID=UPI001C301D67